MGCCHDRIASRDLPVYLKDCSMEPSQVLPSLLLCLFVFPFCASMDTITANRSIRDGVVLVSKENNFALGFFIPGNSSYRYVGIWYFKIPERTVVWVANRDNPVHDSSGVLSINAYGNLVIHVRNRNVPLWSTNVSISATNNTRVAQLFDTGNLVLLDEDTKRVVWQSFDHPSDTMLPGMKLGMDLKSGLNRYLTSWKSPDDPGRGEYSFKLDPRGSPQLFLYKGSTRTWRIGRWPWTGGIWSGYSRNGPAYFYNFTFVDNEDEICYSYHYDEPSVITRTVIDDTGIHKRLMWHDVDRQWKAFYLAPKMPCDDYGRCSAYGKCKSNNVNGYECGCLPGFQPRSPRDWYLRDASGGCVRKRAAAYACGGGAGFLKVARVKVPDTSGSKAERSWSVEACREACLSNCSCIAYALPSISRDTVCLTWYGELIDTIEYTDVGTDLYVRVDAIELAESARKSKGFLRKKGMLAIPLLSVAVALCLMGIFSYAWLKKRRRARDTCSEDSVVAKDELDESKRSPDLALVCLSTIVAATNNFSSLNKLGQGGFGSVYKGQVPNGQEIAVKRLSKSSTQGMEEFKNEVLLIARLQHRNLVKLLGICAEGEEKMLIYEFMPNKSLDFFIFDQTRSSLLDWRKRFEIIVGIARGVLYLHQDSRLRIIHRDLKTSNILLDAEMNPKISDFGIARIFRGDDILGNTNKIAGTYGYMSPEYAVFGKFSTKSDVFSFGVILLEIISGKKNSYFHGDPSFTLIGHIWDLWREERSLDFVNSSLRDSCLPHEVLRCIHIGLLCVEERVEDRPAMPEVVLMLVGEMTLPSPKQPAFVIRSRTCIDLETPAAGGPSSTNGLTVTNIEAR